MISKIFNFRYTLLPWIHYWVISIKRLLLINTRNEYKWKETWCLCLFVNSTSEVCALNHFVIFPFFRSIMGRLRNSWSSRVIYSVERNPCSWFETILFNNILIILPVSSRSELNIIKDFMIIDIVNWIVSLPECAIFYKPRKVILRQCAVLHTTAVNAYSTWKYFERFERGI